MNIVITGSLGHISKPLTKQLIEEGHTITVISSSEERRKEIEALGAQAAIGSLKDEDFLIQTFKEANAVYCMVPPNYEGESDLIDYYEQIGKNYKKAIKKSSVKRVVFLSSFGAHLSKGTGVIVGSHRVEEQLKKLEDISLSRLRPGYFYYNFYGLTGTIKATGNIMANYGAESFPLVAPEDIAKVAAEELTQNEEVNSVRYIASDERNGDEIARVLGKAINKPDLRWKIISDEEMQKGMESAGMSTHIASKLTEMSSAINSGKMAEDYKEHKPKSFGDKKLEDFATEFAAAYEN